MAVAAASLLLRLHRSWILLLMSSTPGKTRHRDTHACMISDSVLFVLDPSSQWEPGTTGQLVEKEQPEASSHEL
jgi:hypothetical protein